MRERHTRRRFLEVALVVGGASAGLTAVAQEDNAEPDLELEGRISGWQGVDPEAIADEENPTLTLVEGEDYVLEWRNGDGRPHNFSIETEGGEDLLATDIISSGGQTVEFTASEEMHEYYCQPHPDSMRGSIELTDDPDDEDAISPTDQEDDEANQEEDGDEQEEPDEEPVETFELTLTDRCWVGQSPDEIADEANPTLELDAGEVYEIVVTVEIEREEHQTGHALTIVDEDGQHVINTNYLGEGESDSIVFTAEDDMVEYIDERQLDIGGDIEVAGGDGEEDDENENDGSGN